MGSSNQFELKEAIENWEKSNFSQKDLIRSDNVEFKDHILNSIDDLLEKDLTEEEAFTIAKMRFGKREDWAEEMQNLNEDNFQLKKIVLLFSGVFLYILSYNFFICLNRLILLLANYYNGDIASNVENVKVFYNVVYALMVSGNVALYFLHKPVKWFFERISINTKWVILFIVLVIIVVLAERILVPQVRNSINDKHFETIVFVSETYFKYINFLIIGVGYIIVYYKYNKKSSM